MLTKQTKIKSKRKAFTLVELLVVVILLGIIAAMIVTNSGGNDGIALKNAIHGLNNEISEVKSLALRDRKPLKMIFKADGTVEVHDATGVIKRASGVPYKFAFADICDQPVKLESADFGSGDKTLYISQEGKAVKGSLSSLTSISRDSNIVLKLRGNKITAKVNPMTIKFSEVKNTNTNNP